MVVVAIMVAIATFVVVIRVIRLVSAVVAFGIGGAVLVILPVPVFDFRLLALLAVLHAFVPAILISRIIGAEAVAVIVAVPVMIAVLISCVCIVVAVVVAVTITVLRVGQRHRRGQHQ